MGEAEEGDASPSCWECSEVPVEGALKCKHLGALGQCGALCTLSGEPRETGAAAEKQVRRVLKEAALVGKGGGGLAVPETSLEKGLEITNQGHWYPLPLATSPREAKLP